MSKYKIIALVGQSGSGKDTIMREVLSKDKNLHEIISYTSRPPREKEVDGVNYHFVSTEEFAELVLNGDMIEAALFNGWAYGTAYGSLDETKVNIGVFNPDGIDSLMDNSNVEVYAFLIEATDKNRLLRQLNREENPNVDEIIRRYSTDKSDFMELDFHHNVINNNNKKELREAVKIVTAAAKRLKGKLNS